VPDWAYNLSENEYREKLLSYVEKTVERYKDSEALELWQVENEPFIKFRFGNCVAFQESAVREEIDLVKKLDPVHQIMITDSGELSWWWNASRAGDLFGTTIYRVVRTSRGMIFTYDWLPAAYYRWKAKMYSLEASKFYIAELQAEPWFTNSNASNTPIGEQKETAGIKRIKSNLDYVSRIGASRVYLWGVEGWYWMKVSVGDSSYWDVVQAELKK
jgi:endo-1,4-beta-mannosidase